MSKDNLNSLKGFLIFTVVLGHFLQTVNGMNFITVISHAIILFIYSFHMPLFIMVSGYLSRNTMKRRNKAFSDLLIPYLVFQLLYELLSMAFGLKKREFRTSLHLILDYGILLRSSFGGFFYLTSRTSGE